MLKKPLISIKNACMNNLKLFFSKVLVKTVGILNSIYTKAHLIRLKSMLNHMGAESVLEYPFEIMGANYISIGSHFVARKRLKLRAFSVFNGQEFTPKITIGNHVSIETDCHIGCINEIEIGSNVLIASHVFISDHSHGSPDYSDIQHPPISRKLISKGKIKIENNVWIGEGAVILTGVTIGENSIIGANSVVSKSIPANTVAVGVPAKVIRQLHV